MIDRFRSAEYQYSMGSLHWGKNLTYQIKKKYLQMNNLQEQIQELNKNLAAQLPTEILETFGQSITDLHLQNIEKSSIEIGQTFPDFNLPNTNNETIALHTLLKKGKVIIAFFRGSWCPYCNLELKALQETLKKMANKSITILAISPQAEKHNQALRNNQQLDFELLTDQNNALAKQIGISFSLQDYVIPVYNNLGINLSDYNNNNSNELPVPAVFVVDTDGSISYKFVDSNYMNRVNIQELIEQL